MSFTKPSNKLSFSYKTKKLLFITPVLDSSYGLSVDIQALHKFKRCFVAMPEEFLQVKVSLNIQTLHKLKRCFVAMPEEFLQVKVSLLSS